MRLQPPMSIGWRGIGHGQGWALAPWSSMSYPPFFSQPNLIEPGLETLDLQSSLSVGPSFKRVDGVVVWYPHGPSPPFSLAAGFDKSAVTISRVWLSSPLETPLLRRFHCCRPVCLRPAFRISAIDLALPYFISCFPQTHLPPPHALPAETCFYIAAALSLRSLWLSLISHACSVCAPGPS
jgi:hypothetical protein